MLDLVQDYLKVHFDKVACRCKEHLVLNVDIFVCDMYKVSASGGTMLSNGSFHILFIMVLGHPNQTMLCKPLSLESNNREHPHINTLTKKYVTCEMTFEHYIGK